MLKFENIKQGDLIVSPCGKQAKILIKHKKSFVARVRGLSATFMASELETFFGGWRVKE